MYQEVNKMKNVDGLLEKRFERIPQNHSKLKLPAICEKNQKVLEDYII